MKNKCKNVYYQSILETPDYSGIKGNIEYDTIYDGNRYVYKKDEPEYFDKLIRKKINKMDEEYKK